MRVLLAVLLVGITGCGGCSPPPGGGVVPTPEGSQAKVEKSPPGGGGGVGEFARGDDSRASVEGREPLTLKGHAGPVTSVSFSPDGKRIVSGSDDNSLKVWDAQTGQETLTLKGHPARIPS